MEHHNSRSITFLILDTIYMMMNLELLPQFMKNYALECLRNDLEKSCECLKALVDSNFL
jgi:hypothetical protein